MLPKRADRLIGSHERVERIEACFRTRRGVCAPAVKANGCARIGYQRVGRQILRRGMHHHRAVDIAEGTAPRHKLLAAAALLGRRAEIPYFSRKIVLKRRKREGGSQTSRGDNVVSAGVTDIGKRIVFRYQGDAGAGAADFGDKARVESVRVARHAHAMAFKGFAKGSDGFKFLEAEFGIGINFPRNPAKVGARAPTVPRS